MAYRKPNLVDSAGLADWISTQKIQYASDTRNDQRWSLDTYLNGDVIVTCDDEVIYSGKDIDAAVAAFNDGY